MKTYRPGFARLFGSFATTLFVVLVLSALWAAFCQLLPWMQESQRAQVRVEGIKDKLVWGGACAAAALGALFALRTALSLPTTRYDLGATDLVVRSGALWKYTRTIPIVEIVRIEILSGPLMRLLGLVDLKVYASREVLPVTLHGIAEADDLRRQLLDRRESLHEAVLSGDYSVAKTPQDMMFERLDRALSRIERHLPPGASPT